MQMTTWAVLGSLLINLALRLLPADAFSAAPPAGAAELHACATHREEHRAPPAPASRQRYLVAVRMGWTI